MDYTGGNNYKLELAINEVVKVPKYMQDSGSASDASLRRFNS